MRTYELVVLLHPDLEIDADTPISKIEKLVENGGGKILRRDNWGKKRLAYKINKQDFAVYVYFDISMDPLKVRDFEYNLSISEEVMRHLLVSQEEPEKAEPKKAKKPAKTEGKEVVKTSEEK